MRTNWGKQDAWNLQVEQYNDMKHSTLRFQNFEEKFENIKFQFERKTRTDCQGIEEGLQGRLLVWVEN